LIVGSLVGYNRLPPPSTRRTLLTERQSGGSIAGMDFTDSGRVDLAAVALTSFRIVLRTGGATDEFVI